MNSVWTNNSKNCLSKSIIVSLEVSRVKIILKKCGIIKKPHVVIKYLKRIFRYNSYDRFFIFLLKLILWYF